MPDSTSRFDDPFADLFGRLPDPRMRGGDAPGPRRTPAPHVDDDDHTWESPPVTGTWKPFTDEPMVTPTGATPVSAAQTGATPAASSGGAPVTPAGGPPAAPTEPVPAADQGSAASTGAVPTSRRAAREALRAQGQTGPQPTAAAAEPEQSSATASLPAGHPSGPQPIQAAGAQHPIAAAAAKSGQHAGRPEQREPLPATAILPVAAQDPASQPATGALSFADFFSEPHAQAQAKPASLLTDARPDSGPIVQASTPAGGNLEDLFMGRASSDDIGYVPPPPDKRRRRVGGWIALGVVLLILGGIAAGGLWVWNTYEAQIREFMGWEEPKDYEEGLATGEALVTISSGDTGGTISQSLYDAGVTKTPEAFYEMLVDAGRNPTFYPGVYQLQKQMTSEAALEALQDPANKLENSALVREGLTVDQTLTILSEGIGIPLEDFQAAVADPSVYGVPVDPAVAEAGGQPLEGWLFPAMYTFDPGATATDVIQTMVNRTIESLDAAEVPAEDRQRVLTVASIIQREARFEEDFYKVARVIENRLNPDNQQTFGLLQMDSTAQYGYGEMHDGTVSSSQEALDDPNPWNTYINAGLPVGPIANPGDVAIDAAMHPADGPWLYFVTVNPDTGETVFTETVQEHEQYVRQWQDWCAENTGRC
ncbi:endolytic transglycosylase MltG [Microbacterium sp. NPDC019599]|uniref:endolytic transglycosylase MltG n=1 Tax=Microbacterium sp. NPDC019599 TaxID=3154690 RepID=UPI0033C80BF1